ncbi:MULTISPECIES: GNAT family N-acetyltransferase [unclassified Kribbella]|uniref:GNAT family N-acetyltransferase n=1 Tax=unclassified Kribbella TaxID=2644121 RepID=UPI0030168174
MRIELWPVTEDDLGLFRRFAVEPGLIGLDWAGFRDPQASVKRYAEDAFLGTDNGRLMVHADRETAGFVSWRSGSYDGKTSYWEIGIALLPKYRGRGIGWRAQAMLTDYLFEHTPVQRIQASTHPENMAEQKSLEKAGFRLERSDPGRGVPGWKVPGWVLVQQVAGRPGTRGRQRFGDGRGQRHVWGTL